MSHKVHLTIDPTVEIEVSDEEYVDLQRQGLLLKSTASTPEGLQRAAVRQTSDKDN